MRGQAKGSNRGLPCRENRLRSALAWLLISSALLLPASAAIELLWDGHDIEWIGLQLIAAGPKNERLRDFAALLGELSGLFLIAGSMLCLLNVVAELVRDVTAPPKR